MHLWFLQSRRKLLFRLWRRRQKYSVVCCLSPKSLTRVDGDDSYEWVSAINNWPTFPRRGNNKKKIKACPSQDCSSGLPQSVVKYRFTGWRERDRNVFSIQMAFTMRTAREWKEREEEVHASRWKEKWSSECEYPFSHRLHLSLSPAWSDVSIKQTTWGENHLSLSLKYQFSKEYYAVKL